jgi:hypothetical protein
VILSVLPESVEAIRSACNSTVSRLLLPARIGQLARHRSIPVIPVGNIPENAVLCSNRHQIRVDDGMASSSFAAFG